MNPKNLNQWSGMKKFIYFCVLFCLILLVSCSKNAGDIDETEVRLGPTPTLIVPNQGFGGIVGKVENADLYWPGQPISVYAAEFYGDVEAGEGTYILETRLFPQSILEESGYFQLDNMPIKAYILVVGPDPESAKPILNQNGDDALIVEVRENEVLDLGNVLIGP
jgi:hypothetical protein